MGALLCVGLAPSVSAEDCPSGDVARGSHAVAIGAHRSLPQLVDEGGPNEGSAWNHPEAVELPSHDAHIRVEFEGARLLRGVAIQADANDHYAVDASLDSETWRRIWLARPVPGNGLRSRSHTLEAPERARYLRIRAVKSDGAASVSGVAAFCKLPVEWPLGVHTGTYPRNWLSQGRIDAIKLGVALAASALFGWGVALRRAGREEVDRASRDGLLALLGVLAAFCWWNLFAFHFYSPVHSWEQFHYYIGSKYQAELGYERLYACTAVADAEDKVFPPAYERTLRDLSTNEIVSTQTVLASPESCTGHFDAERWAEFKKDVGWFRNTLGADRWAQAQLDHGYNATPAWGIAGGWVANTIPVSYPGIRLIASLDSLLLVLMWAGVAWGFGWRGACVAAIWWGTNHAGRFWWVGGGFLRQDWLVLSVLGIALVRRRHHALGGAALAVASLLRVIPAFLIAALLLKWVVGSVRARRLILPREARHFIAGGIVSAFAVVGFSFATAGGPSAWLDFVENSQLHLSTPLTNNIGIEPLAAFEPSTRGRLLYDPEAPDPFVGWKGERSRVFEERQWLALLLIVGFVALLARAVERSEDWVALVLGVGLMPFGATLSCYYYAIWLVYGLLWERAGPRIALALSALSVLTCVLGYWSDWYDEVFAAMSLMMLIFATTVTAWWPALSADEPTESEAN